MLNSLRLVPCSKAHQKDLPFDVCGRRRGFFKNLVLFGMLFAVFLHKKDKLEKQICREIPIKFEPATIFGHPVSCWYIIYIDPNDVGYHRKDGKEHNFVTRTIKEEWPF